MARGRGDHSGGSRGPLPRSVQVSKKLSWLLRHGAEKEGLKLDAQGYLNLQDVLNNRNLRSLKVTFDEIVEAVRDNDKQRFTMIPRTAAGHESTPPEMGGSKGLDGQTPLPSTEPQDYLIRANQGHSLKVESEDLLKPITKDNMPEAAIHGTTHAAWPKIVASGGLKTMGRNHVHFASGLPAGFKAIVDTPNGEGEVGGAAAAPVISGMRKSSTILMFLDVPKATGAGLGLWMSDNGVILTEGDEKGLVPLAYFKRVEDRTGQGILLQDGQVIKEAPKSWTKGKG